jgi:hypothetical protein
MTTSCPPPPPSLLPFPPRHPVQLTIGQPTGPCNRLTVALLLSWPDRVAYATLLTTDQ